MLGFKDFRCDRVLSSGIELQWNEHLPPVERWVSAMKVVPHAPTGIKVPRMEDHTGLPRQNRRYPK